MAFSLHRCFHKSSQSIWNELELMLDEESCALLEQKLP